MAADSDVMASEHKHGMCPVCRERDRFTRQAWDSGEVTPCPARGVAVLGFAEPTEVHCGGIEGHPGPHHYSIEWAGTRCTSLFPIDGRECEYHDGHTGTHRNGTIEWGSY